MPLSLEVTFGAYLAVLLGTFVPVTFLIVLYSQVSFIIKKNTKCKSKIKTFDSFEQSSFRLKRKKER